MTDAVPCLPLLLLQVMVVQLINALVSSPEELDMRVHLRNEFHACGFSAFLAELHDYDVSTRNSKILGGALWIPGVYVRGVTPNFGDDRMPR